MALPLATNPTAPHRWHLCRLLILGVLVTSLAACATREPAPRAPAPRGADVDLMGVEVRPVSDAILGTASYDLPVVANNWVQSELEFLLNERRSTVEAWLRRGDVYRSFVQEIFRQEGIPTDLYHLAMIESGYTPTARSPVGAVGMWQFMPATSRDVGLRIDSSVDERMDPVRSTRAAARHLRSLYRIHGDWALAAAAYNAGSGRISRGLQRFGARDFWDLAQRGDLAAETQHYVPRLYAMTIIGRDPGRFGFQQGASATFAFDSVHVEYSVPLDELADAGGVSAAVLREMNPHLVQGHTPAGGYWVWVPEGAGPRVQRAYIGSSLGRSQPSLASYTVRWGDSLGRIAQRSGVEGRRIRELNPDVDFDRLQTGAVLRLPPDAVERLAAAPATPATSSSTAAATAPARDTAEEDREELTLPTTRPVLMTAAEPEPEPEELRTHTVAPGEHLSGIASRYGVPLAELQAANGITGSVIRPGQRLAIPVSGARAASPAPAAAPAVADAPAPAPAAAPPAAAASEEHVVAAGETLSAIAQRYGTTVTALREANGIEGSVIVPGQRLRISGGSAPAPAVEREHVVTAGENLTAIARRYGTTIAEIQRLNGIEGSVIRPGQRLRIPPASASGNDGSAAESAPTVHVVEAGETLWGIAQRYGATVGEIERLNELGSRPIIPGQRLRIPR